VLIISVLGIVTILLTVSSLLIATSLSGLNLPKTEFRETVTEIYFGSRAAVAIGLADVSKRLNHEASKTLYQNYTTLEELNGSENSGLELVSDWQKDSMRNYPAVGLNLSLAQPMFQCNWYDPVGRHGYSMVNTNVSIALLNYGFECFRDEILIEFNATLEELISTNGRETSFKVRFVREEGYPIERMYRSLVSVFFEIYDRTNDHRSLNETDVKSVRYLGNGTYLISYLSDINNIPSNLSILRDNMTSIDPANLTVPPSDLLDIVDEVEVKYDAGNRTGAFLQLLSDLRPKLDPSSPETVVVPGTDTAEILLLIDTILSQLRPNVRIVARDLRGITVGVYGELDTPMNDTWGPTIFDEEAVPDQCGIGESVLLSARADDRLSGNANVTMVEYFISESQPEVGQYGSGTNMTPTDGAFDESVEEVEATILGGELSTGENYIWIHARDSLGNWGGFETVVVTVMESNTLHIDGIEMQGYYGYWWFWRYNWVEATVTIVDGSGSPVEGATVHGFWSGHVSGEDERITLSDGTCVFESDILYGQGRKTYTFTVDNVYKDGYTWDGVIASETLEYP